MWSYLLRCRLQKRPHLLKKKSLPALPNFFGVVTQNTNKYSVQMIVYVFTCLYVKSLSNKNMFKLNTHIILFGPTKHAKHFETMAELIYAELIQGRESTRLPHTYKFTSLKNVVISDLHIIDK